MEFTTVDGAGNSFLLGDLRGGLEVENDRELGRVRASASDLCAAADVDGVLLVVRAPAGSVADATMVVFNRDGTRPEMCGNGLRCVAAYLARRGSARSLTIDTDAGPRDCEVLVLEQRSAVVRVDMGRARGLGSTCPASTGGRRFVGVSTGNPHAVCFVDGREDPDALAREFGAVVENDAAYAPARTNVEFARIDEDGSVRLAVWERGVGWTSACGTGACAAVFAAVHEGLMQPDVDVTVVLAGGTLTIRVASGADRGVSMTGDTNESATATLSLV